MDAAGSALVDGAAACGARLSAVAAEQDGVQFAFRQLQPLLKRWMKCGLLQPEHCGFAAYRRLYLVVRGFAFKEVLEAPAPGAPAARAVKVRPCELTAVCHVI